MKTQKKLTVGALKTLYREYAKEDGFKITFSRNKPIIKCVEDAQYSPDVFTVVYNEDDAPKNIGIRILEIRDLNPYLLSHILDYFVQYAYLEKISYVTFNFKEATENISNSIKVEMLKNILCLIGFEPTSKGIYTYATTILNRNISTLINEVKNALNHFVEDGNLSFDWSQHIPILGAKDAEGFNDSFLVYYINWRGYKGYWSLTYENDTLYLKEAYNLMENVSLNFEKLPFTIDNLGEVLKSFTNTLPEQMAFHNLFHPPTFQLEKLFYHFIKKKNEAEEVMIAFKELGYSFKEIDDELAKLRVDIQYRNDNTFNSPYYSISRRYAVSDKIIKIHSHYLILMHYQKDNMFKFAIVDSEDKFEDAVLKLEQAIKAEANL